MSLEDDSLAFGRLLDQATFIPDWLKTGYSNGMMGKTIPSLEDITNLAHLELYRYDINDLHALGFHLSEDEKEDYKKSSCFLDELISSTLRRHYGWGLPAEETLQDLTQWLNYNKSQGLIEFGAGSGLWSALLSPRLKIQVIACELNLRKDTPRPRFCEVLNQDGLKIMKTYPDYPVLVVWMDTDDISEKIVEQMAPGNTLILAGPVDVTGTNKFYDLVDKNYSLEGEFKSAKFTGGSYDSVYILKKLSEPKNNPTTFFSSQRNKHSFLMKKPF